MLIKKKIKMKPEKDLCVIKGWAEELLYLLNAMSTASTT